MSLVCCLIASAAGLTEPAHAAPAGRRAVEALNVLFIAIDDLRPELGCYGCARVRTPHIDRLASSGLLFENHYVQIAVCVPSRVALLTGVRPDTTRQLYGPHVFRNNCPGITTMPEVFAEAGYETVSLGKIYHFEETIGFTEPPWQPAWDQVYTQPPHRGRMYWAPGESRSAFPPTERAQLPESAYMDGQTTERTLETLRRLAGGSRPFWLGVGFLKPHLPFVAPEKYWALYETRSLSLSPHRDRPAGMPGYAFNDWADLRSFQGIPGDTYAMHDDLARELIHGYLACVSFVDAQVGRLLEALEALNLRERTIVVLWGDHGWHLGDQGMWSKSTNLERATWAPLIVSAPGRPARGRTTAALVESVDVFPTLCELAGLPIPAQVEGTSFAPLFDDPDRTWKTAVFSQYYRSSGPDDLVMGYSIRTASHRYTEWARGWQGEEVLSRELYAYEYGRDESANEVNNPALRALVSSLGVRLRAGWRSERPPRPSGGATR